MSMLCQIMDKSESGGGEIPSSVFPKIRLHAAAVNAVLGLAQALKFSSPVSAVHTMGHVS